jgi:hypothetical protein
LNEFPHRKPRGTLSRVENYSIAANSGIFSPKGFKKQAVAVRYYRLAATKLQFFIAFMNGVLFVIFE